MALCVFRISWDVIVCLFQAHVYLPGPRHIWKMLVVCEQIGSIPQKCPQCFDLGRNVSISVVPGPFFVLATIDINNPAPNRVSIRPALWGISSILLKFCSARDVFGTGVGFAKLVLAAFSLVSHWGHSVVHSQMSQTILLHFY